jgi:hypothetical protein
LPIGQLVQLPTPDVALNLPIGQSKQSPPAGPSNPALQAQSVLALLLVADVESDGHALHAVRSASA